MSERFVADVGGTNIRLARAVDGQLFDIKKYLCKDFDTISDAIKGYFAEFPELTFSSGCFGIACPTNNDLITMTNHHWQFSVKELKRDLQLDWLGVINDFTAVAMSLPVLSDDQKYKVGGGDPVMPGNVAVFGPGTGLGVGHLVPVTEGWQPLAGEGGHVDFAPVDETDVVIWRALRDKHGRVSAEQLLSGRGLLQIYIALAEHQGATVKFSEPADVTTHGLSGECAICEAALKQFCAVMGSFAGNLALNLGTEGGVYISGGIVTRFLPFFENSTFRERFEAKGRFKDYCAAIPTYVITEPDHALLGAAAYLEQNFKG